MTTRRTPTVLLVEDDPGHALLVEKNLKRAGVADRIVCLRSGREALDYLDRQFAEGRAPDEAAILMLLDLNMPVLDGYEVLKAVKSRERTRTIPVVVLTTTDSPPEIERCYKLGCNAYITKPVDYEQFADVMQRLGMFLSIVKLPMREECHG